ncbi:HNH endonuclease [Rhodopseudomonas sp.]|uniref:HNH endonuclease n=1 Tax=Rhodopseudomonas sp. TaxID=1078 RepID=UPI0039E5E02E
MSHRMKLLPPNRAVRLANRTCPYCGVDETERHPFTVEHVVGRRFVPKGSLNKSWALIVRACEACNAIKSDLEDDISAITLQPHIGDRHNDPLLHAEASRKAKGSISRRTKKVIGESHEQTSIEGKIMSAIDVKFEMISPPQLIEKRVHELANMHLQGFFYLMSYNEQERRGGFLPGPVGFVANANRPDWGNPLLRAFAQMTAAWPQQLDCICASGFFKLAMRRETETSPLWSFAIEWNGNHRIVGFFGDLVQAQAYVNAMPDLQWKQWNAGTRYRIEIPLEPEHDLLFASRFSEAES